MKKIEDLAFDYTGQSMQVNEDTARMVYGRYDQMRYDSYAKQNRWLEWGTLLAPMTGVSLISMALSGNDLIQHHDFTRQVEEHRYTMNKLLNDYVSSHAKKTATGWDGVSLKGDRALWQSIPAFKYHPPAWPIVAKTYSLCLALLAVWGVVALGFARVAVARLSGV